MPIVIAQTCTSFKTSVLSILLSECHLFPLHSLRTSDFLQPHFQSTVPPSFFCQNLSPASSSQPTPTLEPCVLCFSVPPSRSTGKPHPWSHRIFQVWNGEFEEWLERNGNPCHLVLPKICSHKPQGAHASHQPTPFPRQFIIPFSEGTIPGSSQASNPPVIFITLSSCSWPFISSEHPYFPSPQNHPPPCVPTPHVQPATPTQQVSQLGSRPG